MATIKQDDLIQSVADSLQYISYYHSPDFVDAMHKAWLREESESAKNAIAQILINSRMSAEGKRPICQDTGIVVVFVKVGMNVQWDASMSLQEMIDEGVRQLEAHGVLRPFRYPLRGAFYPACEERRCAPDDRSSRPWRSARLAGRSMTPSPLTMQP